MMLMWDHTNLHRDATTETPHKKPLVLLLMLLFSRVDCDPQGALECCRQPARSCHLYMLLCRGASRSHGGALPGGDAAAGILTLGKRNEDELPESRLQQLLHGSRNQAAGILTMGKRTEGAEGKLYRKWLGLSRTAVLTPPPA